MTYGCLRLAVGVPVVGVRGVMPEILHNSQQGFWRPPLQPETGAIRAAATCQGCGSEYISGSQFCHTCGTSRLAKAAPSAEANWKTLSQSLRLLKALQFQNVQAWFGLSTASLAAFLVGIGCVLAAIAVGLIYSAQTLADFQAIQLWRIEWLLAAVAAFMAGILLKKSGSVEKEKK
jgi:hypothetical protein